MQLGVAAMFVRPAVAAVMAAAVAVVGGGGGGSRSPKKQKTKPRGVGPSSTDL